MLVCLASTLSFYLERKWTRRRYFLKRFVHSISVGYDVVKMKRMRLRIPDLIRFYSIENTCHLLFICRYIHIHTYIYIYIYIYHRSVMKNFAIR